jgi:beta-glucosidase/6-phospho-beta-glucosidase/beta-galactosidase
MRHLFMYIILPVLARGMFIGTATSSYQIEGVLPGQTIWDVYTREHGLEEAGNATMHYERFREDLALMARMGVRDYRMSISWTRIMPSGTGEADPDGLRFYHDVLDECRSLGISVYATLYHWDLPARLDDGERKGWLDPDIVGWFLRYATRVIQEYDAKVVAWFTINEPLTTSAQGYGTTCGFAPGRCSRENMLVSAHLQLLAHAAVAGHYLEHYPGGRIGIVLNTNWFEPLDGSDAAREWSERRMAENYGWFMDPLFFGEYPEVMREEASALGLVFTAEQKAALASSFTLIAVNHYTTYYVNARGEGSVDRAWDRSQAPWLFDAPLGMERVLHYIGERYSRTLPVYVTEFGVCAAREGEVDLGRVHYLSGYIDRAIAVHREGAVNLRGLFVWSFLDNFEWTSGYSQTYGIVAVDRRHGLARRPRLSYFFLQDLIHRISDGAL